MAVARLAAAVSIKQEPPDTPTSTSGQPTLMDTTSIGSPTHPVEPKPVHPVELDERILNLCLQYPKGITDDIITQDQPQINTEQRMKALQRLLSQGKIDLLKQGSSLVYRLKATTSSTTSKTKGFEREERLVYQIIEDAGNKGIWIRDIRIKSNLPQQQTVKTLKTLESKKLIKSVKSVQQGLKKKVYMLAELTPDESVTGGAWYSDQDFESEFVEVLNQQCLKYLQQKATKAHMTHKDPLSRKGASYASSKEVCKYIMELGISKVRLTTGNIETILNTLLYDGQAEMTLVASGAPRTGEESEEEEDDVQRLYCATKQLLRDTGFSRVPCGMCPVLEQCCEGGAISPSSCRYMKDWLKY